ncbi:MAG: tRNA 2-thiouridine(34) synthase MnmA [Firmicutes bacterium]|nr:tRNA 2-thiouridine(34) synthase MnmA [Candidatus Fermentithermobacillaceae bacterium]
MKGRSNSSPVVAVAMSGGVDSSVAAKLLVDQGYQVIGFTMMLVPPSPDRPEFDDVRGKFADAVESARRVARLLGIPHHVVDLSAEFERKVVSPFVRSYEFGFTPNPCLWCNPAMKFGALFAAAREFGAEKLATGHYATVRFDPQKRRWLLLRGRDRGKDQSYVLYGLTQEMLGRSIFPLGDFTKQQVRKMAKEFGLPSAAREESQEICFVGPGGYAALLQARGIRSVPGDIVDLEGNVIGRHRGIVHYTIGQRKGLGLSRERPVYVVGIDAEKNRLIVAERDKAYFSGAYLEGFNLISEERLEGPVQATCAVRYRGKEVPCTLEVEGQGDKATVFFHVPQFAVTPGQGAVLYQGDIVLGGGIIVRAWR